MDQMNLTAWQGRAETLTGGVDSAMAGMIHATLGAPQAPAPVPGDVLPQLWHWCAFPPTVPTTRLGSDGHPPLGGFLPPVPLARRMWAGGSLTFLRPLHVGERLTRHSTIRAVTEKSGTVGDMVFVTVDHVTEGESGPAIEESQDIVYLDIPDRFTPPKKIPLPESTVAEETVAVSPALLFRYSAITFNAHRIHYDLPYTQEVEHYPGLVVHGPMQATFLMDLATRHKGRAPDAFRFRGVHPMFHFEDMALLAHDEAGAGLKLCTASPQGHQGLQATATWEEKQ